MTDDFYKKDEIEQIGFKRVGDNIKISKKASFYGVQNIEIGDNVRIDDFCILSGKINLGSFIHISAYCGIFAGDTGVDIGDFCTISSRNVIYAESDDYSGASMTNPMINDEFRNLVTGQVVINKYSIVGTGCTILPGVTIGEGVAVGAMSLVKRDLSPWKIYYGIPATEKGDRKKELLKYVNKMTG